MNFLPLDFGHRWKRSNNDSIPRLAGRPADVPTWPWHSSAGFQKYGQMAIFTDYWTDASFQSYVRLTPSNASLMYLPKVPSL